MNIEYVAVEELKMSDHRPVKASFSVKLDMPAQQKREEKVEVVEEVEQPVGIAESLLGVARSQVCGIQWDKILRLPLCNNQNSLIIHTENFPSFSPFVFSGFFDHPNEKRIIKK